MIRGLLQKAYGNAIVGANLRGQRRIPYLREDELRGMRDRRLREIVLHASRHVPYYRELFESRRIDPREIRSAEDLERLPLIDKVVVARDPGRFLSSSRSGRHAMPFRTSGSTGTRLTVHHDYASLLANVAFGERERAVLAGLCRREFGYQEAYVLYPGSTNETVRGFYERWTFIPTRPERLMLSVLDPLERTVELIDEFRPDLLVSYGSYLEMLFKALAARGLEMHRPRALVYVSDAMTPEGRAFVEAQFGIPVLSRYNAVEAFKIGFSCEQRTGFHLHGDLCHVKIVDGRGDPVGPGERGEVVISNLVNRATVLLNYRLGDLASISPTPCPCGRTLQLLSELEGRVEDIICLPDGRFVHPRAVWLVFKQRHDVLQYQLTQEEPTRFALKLATADRETYQRLIDGILRDLRSLLGAGATIEAERHDRLEVNGPAKFRTVISRLRRGGDG
jgi:phenylacetate-CoA ligase